jgi:CubicO group peptidase (beta-lactamase class C family)
MRLYPIRTAVLAAVAGAGALAASAEAEGRWPTAGWDLVTPESAGFESAKLAEAVLRIRAEVPHAHAVFLEMNGQAFLDASFYPYDGAVMHNLASVTKSVMTTLIAIAADQGRVDLDQPMLDFFADRTVANLDERKRRITVRHLTGMVSGLACAGEHDEPTLHQMNASPDWVQFTLDLPMAAEPGTTFSYCSPGMHLLSAILQEATGATAFDFAKENLFGPLGITEAAWPADAQGVSHGWGDLRLFPRDAAKIGYLWINGGRWEGRQIVSEDWVEASSSFKIETGDYWGEDYGYGWWILSDDDDVPGYAAAGRGGQRISVFPTLDIVAVTTGGGIDPGDVLERLATAMVSPGEALPENPDGQRALEAALAAVLQPPAPVAPAAPPPLAAEVSGRTYRFAPNPLGLATIRPEFDAPAVAGFAMTFSDGQPPREGLVGLDGVLRMFPGEDGVTAGMRGGWTPDGRLRAEYDGIAMIDAFDLLLSFDGDRLVMAAKDRTYEEGVTLEGRAD